MQFRKITLIEVSAALLSGLFALYLAYHGYGVYALVYQTIAASVLSALFLWLSSSWKPSFMVSKASVKEIFSFSSKTLLDEIISTIYARLDVMFIGKIFTPYTLGVYSRAQSLDTLITTYSTNSISQVFLPSISKLQNKHTSFNTLFTRAFVIVSVLSTCMAGLLYLVAHDLLVLLFGSKWIESVKYFEVLVMASFVIPASTIMVQAILGKGHAGKNLKLGLTKKVLGIITLSTAYFYGIIFFLYAKLLQGLFSLHLNIAATSQTTTIKKTTLWGMVIKPVLIALTCVLSIKTLSQFHIIESNIGSLISKSILYLILYGALVLLIYKKHIKHLLSLTKK